MTPARRSDWKALDMPDATAPLDAVRVLTPGELARLRLGVVPRAMEEKWFVYFEHPWLYLHRSWTGVCVYAVRFEEFTGGAVIAEAVANRAPGQYTETDPEADSQRLLALLDSVIRRNERYAPPPPEPGAR